MSDANDINSQEFLQKIWKKIEVLVNKTINFEASLCTDFIEIKGNLDNNINLVKIRK